MGNNGYILHTISEDKWENCVIFNQKAGSQDCIAVQTLAPVEQLMIFFVRPSVKPPSAHASILSASALNLQPTNYMAHGRKDMCSTRLCVHVELRTH